nr:endoribonuclease dicer like 3 [Quercus suber]
MGEDNVVSKSKLVKKADLLRVDMADINNLKEMIVLAIHTGKIYFVVESTSTKSLTGKTLEAGVLVKKAQMHVHMPPELLIRLNVSRGVLRSFYLLPSVMHRLEPLMLASQLREEICCSSNFHISSALILEALTSLRCSENFSMECLELLGIFVMQPYINWEQIANDRDIYVTVHLILVVGLLLDSVFMACSL